MPDTARQAVHTALWRRCTQRPQISSGGLLPRYNPRPTKRKRIEKKKTETETETEKKKKKKEERKKERSDYMTLSSRGTMRFKQLRLTVLSWPASN